MPIIILFLSKLFLKNPLLKQLQETFPSTQKVNTISAGEGTNSYRVEKPDVGPLNVP